MSKEVKQEGMITQITPEKITVNITVRSACVGCAAKSACGTFDMSDKLVEIYNEKIENWKVGEYVTVCMKPSMGRKAVLFAYILPLVILISTLIYTVNTTGDEVTGALMGLLSAGLYFSLIFLLKKFLFTSFTFTIEKSDLDGAASNCAI
ncbi:MAG: SoxR reducing system RseC family protein [Bacteroidales bacterium]|jgi:sigma-E factor negative regulatory protein RseC|nr:SoxR reducing system RseC family protein [Bacteroidales bacterium]